jgi:hypothetical protein
MFQVVVMRRCDGDEKARGVGLQDFARNQHDGREDQLKKMIHDRRSILRKREIGLSMFVVAFADGQHDIFLPVSSVPA